jgi:Domain of unknown function (DUF4329)
MSQQRLTFEAEMRKPAPDWSVAIPNLVALAMFEMLPTLEGISINQRQDVVDQATKMYAAGINRGWGPDARIAWAANVVTMLKIPANPPSDLPPLQVKDGKNYLASKLKPAASRAGMPVFATIDSAGSAALDEINPFSIAIREEFAGAIYQLTGRFAFTAPLAGDETSSQAPISVPVGASQVGTYHTHGAGFLNSTAAESFSVEDRNARHALSVKLGRQMIFYLGTPSRHILKLVPNTREGTVSDLGLQILVR